MAAVRSKENLERRLAQFLKKEIASAGWTYSDLAHQLERHGWPGEKASTIKQKLHRASFSAVFFIQVVSALGLKTISLKDI